MSIVNPTNAAMVAAVAATKSRGSEPDDEWKEKARKAGLKARRARLFVQVIIGLVVLSGIYLLVNALGLISH